MKIILEPSDLKSDLKDKNIEELTLHDFFCFCDKAGNLRLADMAHEIRYVCENGTVFLKCCNYKHILNKIYNTL